PPAFARAALRLERRLAIRRVELARHDGLGAELAALLVDLRAASLEMAHEAKRWILPRRRDQIAEHLLARAERLLAEVIAVDEQQIGCEERRALLPRLG